jgi:hypothetical protein
MNRGTSTDPALRWPLRPPESVHHMPTHFAEHGELKLLSLIGSFGGYVAPHSPEKRARHLSYAITWPGIEAMPSLFRSGVIPWHLLEPTYVNFFTQQALRAELTQWFDEIAFARIERFTISGVDAFTRLVAISAHA